MTTSSSSLIDSKRDGLYHKLGKAEVLLVIVGIWGGFDDGM